MVGGGVVKDVPLVGVFNGEVVGGQVVGGILVGLYIVCLREVGEGRPHRLSVLNRRGTHYHTIIGRGGFLQVVDNIVSHKNSVITLDLYEGWNAMHVWGYGDFLSVLQLYIQVIVVLVAHSLVHTYTVDIVYKVVARDKVQELDAVAAVITIEEHIHR